MSESRFYIGLEVSIGVAFTSLVQWSSLSISFWMWPIALATHGDGAFVSIHVWLEYTLWSSPRSEEQISSHKAHFSF